MGSEMCIRDRSRVGPRARHTVSPACFPITSMSSNVRTRCLAMSSPVPKEAIVGEEIDKGATESRRVTRLIRLPEVQHRVGLGRSTIYRWMSEGKFPKPVQLGGYSVAWSEREVEAWISDRLK